MTESEALKMFFDIALEFMVNLGRRALRGTSIAALAMLAGTSVAFADPLPSWNAGAAKSAIEMFVRSVATPGSAQFVPPAERIAVFDNDGTLMAEEPNINLAFALDQVRDDAPAHPEWNNEQPFKAILQNDRAYVAHIGHDDLTKLYLATFAGTDEATFENTARSWLGSARNPILKARYIDLVYQPQIELLHYLRDNGFKVFLVTGGDVDFVRAFAFDLYGIPPWRVVGSSIRFKLMQTQAGPELMRSPTVDSFNIGAAKASNIHLAIGLTPIFAFGNSDDDESMLALTGARRYAHLALILHHDDGKREFAYDMYGSPFTRLDKVLDEAPSMGWQVVSMRNDFNTVFPKPESAAQGK
jgi:hypothetical protein